MRSLSYKLILAFLIVSLSGTALLAVLAGRLTVSEFGDFIIDQRRDDLAQTLGEEYQQQGSWMNIEGRPPFAGRPPGGMRDFGPGGRFTLVDADGHVVLPGGGHAHGKKIPQPELANGTPILVEGQVVGTLLGSAGPLRFTNPAGLEFVGRVNRTLILSALGATAVALLLGVTLARTLTRPLRELTAATRAVAAGDLSRRVQVPSRDELGDLASAFNQMTIELTHARNLRQQMTADIAHELRTPISVILGHVDALDEGVLPPTEETFRILREETTRLERLVDDLRTLSQADAGELSLLPRRVAPEALVRRAAAAHEPLARSKQITLRLEVDPEAPQIMVDPDRLAQVLDNLLANALRHTPERGEIALLAVGTPEGVEILIQDTGPGIPEEDLDRVFDRFYRPETSRSRSSGGSGLGLAIAKSIVQAHGGDIRAERAPSGGTAIVVRLPAGEEDLTGGSVDPG